MSKISVEDVPSTTSRPAPRSIGADRLPWPSLLVLGAATLLMVTTEMLPTAVLTPMSVGLGVPEARTAQLVSLWAAVVVVASFPLVRLTRRFDRRVVISVGMLTLAGSSALTAAAPSYGAAVGGRLAGALAVGLLWATVNAHVADLVSDRLLGPAIAVVLGGATLGMVVGTPVARMVADLAGWRSAFVVVAVVAAVVGILVRVVVASAVPSRGDPAGRRPTGRLRPMLLTTVLVGLLLVGHYGAYTFITRLAEAPAQLVPGQVGGLLLAFGLASALGVSIAGRIGNSTALALVAAAGATAAAILGLTLADGNAVVGLAVVLVWGVVSGALPPLAQTQIFRQAGPEHRATAGAVIPVVFNGGIAVGAALAAQLTAHHGIGALPVPAGTVVAAAALGLAGAAALRRTAAPPVSAPGAGRDRAAARSRRRGA
jgi:predicted MFS family arabinose efflux permease